MTRLVKLRKHWAVVTRSTSERFLGLDRNDAKEIRVLGRQVRWNSGSEWSWVEYEPDKRHAERIFKLLQLESARCMATLIVEKFLEEVTATFQPLDASRTRLYRNVVMRAAHLSQD